MASAPPPSSFAALYVWLLVAGVAATTGDADSASSGSRRARSGSNQVGADAPDDEEGREGGDLSVILDSGASNHATADRCRLSGFDAARRRDAVHRTRDGTELPAAGAGTVASDKFQLPDVLHVPGLVPGTVLVSVQELARRGYLVMFGGAECLVMDRKAGKLVGQGRLQEHNGLYRLDSLKVPLDAPAPAAAAAAQGTESNVV